jgi:hypothetical protein
MSSQGSGSCRIEIKETLIHWGRWTHDRAHPRLGYPTMTPYERLVRPSLGRSYNMTDEQGLRIDHLLAELSTEMPKVAEAIYLYYRYPQTLQQLADSLRCHRSTAVEWIKIGEAWLEPRTLTIRL